MVKNYSQGDVAEVFLKPERDTYYWELYVTPTGRKTTFFIPGHGCHIMSLLPQNPIEMKVAGKSQGTVNNWYDKDQGWVAEMAISRKKLEKYGAKLGPGQKWRIFVIS